MNHLLMFLRRTLIVFLVGTFMAVNTFTGEAFAQGAGNTNFTNACTLIPNDYAGSGITQPEFQNPPFAYADTEYESNVVQNIAEYTKVKDRHTITFDAVQDTFYLEGGSDNASTAYDGYLYKAIFPGKNGVEKTIVQDDDTSDSDGIPGKLKIVNYRGNENNMVGTYTPPTIVVSLSKENDPDTLIDESRANSINLNLINDLPVNVQLAGSLPQTKENLESVSQYTNIHYHGFNVSPLLGADDVLVEVHSNVTPKPITISKTTTSPTNVEVPSGSSDTVDITYTINSDNEYKVIPVPPLGETTPDSSTGSSTNLPGGYYPNDDPSDPKYGGPISEYKMDVNIPDVHQSGVFWYHSHAHSMSDNQVRGGLSGGIIITGSDGYYRILSPDNGIQVTADTSPKLEIDPEPEEFSVNQKIMMFKDFNNQIGGGGVDCFTVNGQLNPTISIRPGEVQLWRMANIGADTYMNIALEKLTSSGTDNEYTAELANPNGEQNFYILSRDGDFVNKVVSTDSVLLPPASRVDVLVVGDSTTDGSTYNLVSDFSTGLTEGQLWGAGNSYVLATVEASANDKKVCYETKGGEQLSLGTICSGGDTLYDHIEKQRAISQTRRPNEQLAQGNRATLNQRSGGLPFGPGDFPNATDKILPNPTWLSFDLPECEGNQNFVNNFCLTPSDAYSDPLTKKRYFYFNQDFSNVNFLKFFLQGFEDKQSDPINDVKELYDGIRIDKVSEVGDLEEWHLINSTPSPHVFHIHQLDFVVTQVNLPTDPCTGLGVNEKCTYNNYTVGTKRFLIDSLIILPPERCELNNGQYECPLLPQGYRDVINLPPNSETIVRIPFVNPFITGPFVYHCHILGHEDRGMMNNLKVVNTKGYGEKDVRRAIRRLPVIVKPYIDKMKQKMRESN